MITSMRMKLIEAMKLIEEREERQRQKRMPRAVKDMQKAVVVLRETNETERNIVPVKTYLLQEDVIKLKKKTREGSITGAISKAVDYYLKFGEDE